MAGQSLQASTQNYAAAMDARTTQAKQPTAADTLAQDLTARFEMACQIEGRLRNVLVRLRGSIPEAVSKEPVQPTPSGLLSQIAVSMEGLRVVQNRIGDSLNELETII